MLVHEICERNGKLAQKSHRVKKTRTTSGKLSSLPWLFLFSGAIMCISDAYMFNKVGKSACIPYKKWVRRGERVKLWRRMRGGDNSKDEKLRDMREAIGVARNDSGILGITDNFTLTRFLKARGWDVGGAVDQFRECEKFRKTFVEETKQFVTNNSELVSRIHAAHRMDLFTTDQYDRPVMLNRVGSIDVESLMNISTSEYARYHVSKMEESQKLGKAINQMSIIFDCEGLGFGHLRLWKKLLKIANINNRYYPETVHKAVIIRSGWVFPLVYTLIQPLLDHQTKQKVMVCKISGVRTGSGTGSGANESAFDLVPPECREAVRKIVDNQPF
ncbi:hypothetical protein AAMO2058_001354600 [Amorphochlora amoebiformis]